MAMSITKRIVAGVAALVMVTSLSACGGSSTSSDAKKPGSLSEVKNKVKNDMADEEKSDEMKDKETTDEMKDKDTNDSGDLDPFLVSLASQLNASSDTLLAGQSDVSGVRVFAEAPNTLVLEYKVSQDLEPALFQEGVKAVGVEQLQKMADKLKQALTVEGVSSPSVKIIYIDSTDEELFAQTF